MLLCTPSPLPTQQLLPLFLLPTPASSPWGLLMAWLGSSQMGEAALPAVPPSVLMDWDSPPQSCCQAPGHQPVPWTFLAALFLPPSSIHTSSRPHLIHVPHSDSGSMEPVQGTERVLNPQKCPSPGGRQEWRPTALWCEQSIEGPGAVHT